MRGALFKRLLRDEAAASVIEFALMLPLLMYLGGGGIEYANYGLAQLRVSQTAMTLADNASRVGLSSTLATTQIRETDINDIFAGVRLQSNGLKLTTYGRITLSSLEYTLQSYDVVPVQRIHWQRCLGKRSGANYDSSYGTTSVTAGTSVSLANAGTVSTGMGDATPPVTAPLGYGVMFVEINYDYQPLFGTLYAPPMRIHYIASYIVRDTRDYSMIYNPSPSVTPSTCNLYTT
ncbi:TadE/TadG family type IV pilus assembly protein [Novosphingobium rosa]|uniref:TadE/TadG family type IV pilus assembly protein n=1 Tax=Novosphingobium rosa TaxID=76978 RepID=UPI000833505C|nr:TadE/TadG family type IV pilus assembly protein [Novosphingobium rosa]